MLKFAGVAQSQAGLEEQPEQLAKLVQAQEAATTALERRKRAWAAAGAAPTGHRQVRYRGSREQATASQGVAASQARSASRG